MKKDYSQALYWLNKAYSSGADEAVEPLGICYYQGYGVSKDYQKAVSFFEKGVKFGYSRCKAYLGTCYLLGLGVVENKDKALELILDAAYEGDELGLKLKK